MTEFTPSNYLYSGIRHIICKSLELQPNKNVQPFVTCPVNFKPGTFYTD